MLYAIAMGQIITQMNAVYEHLGLYEYWRQCCETLLLISVIIIFNTLGCIVPKG